MTRAAVPRGDVRLRDVLAVPFALVRVPLSAVDRQVVQRLAPRSTVRAVFDCSLGSVDILAGHLLGDDGITQYGMGRVRAAMQDRPRHRRLTASAGTD